LYFYVEECLKNKDEKFVIKYCILECIFEDKYVIVYSVYWWNNIGWIYWYLEWVCM